MTTPTQNALNALPLMSLGAHEDTIRKSLQTLEALMPLVEELVSMREKATEGEWCVNWEQGFGRYSPNGAGIQNSSGVRVAAVTRNADKCLDQKIHDAQFIATAANISNKIKEVLK